MIDVSGTIVAKSDQLNADDLIGGPITVTITRVEVNQNPKAEQPVAIHIDGGHQPWKPSKTMRRVLVAGWGADAAKWIGRMIVLIRNPDVKWAGKAVGGIEIAAMSDIPARIKISLAEAKGKKSDHLIEVLKSDRTMTLDELKRACGAALKAGWTRDQITDALGGQAADVPPNARKEIAARLAGKPPSDAGEIGEEERAAILAAEREEAEQ